MMVLHTQNLNKDYHLNPSILLHMIFLQEYFQSNRSLRILSPFSKLNLKYSNTKHHYDNQLMIMIHTHNLIDKDYHLNQFILLLLIFLQEYYERILFQ
jgi:hypothetical protein